METLDKLKTNKNGEIGRLHFNRWLGAIIPDKKNLLGVATHLEEDLKDRTADTSTLQDIEKLRSYLDIQVPEADAQNPAKILEQIKEKISKLES